MELVIRGKKMELAEPVRSYVEKKMSRVIRHLPSITEAKVELSKEKAKSPQSRYVVQITLNSNGILLRAEEREVDIYAAIDQAADVIDRQVKRYKDKFYLRGRRSPRRRVEPIPSTEPVEKERLLDRVVRIKRFPIKPMTPGEAMEQMELLGHDFFLFRNIATNQFSILYRRKDGDYGLIEPESF